MERQIPLFLIFSCDAAEVIAGIDDFVRDSDGAVARALPSVSPSDQSLIWNGLQFALCLAELPELAADAQPILCSSMGTKSSIVFSLNFSEHAAGGSRLPEIAQAFLKFAALLVRYLSPDRVLWVPGNLLVDPEYFAETVADYTKGGAFPVLATIKLTWSPEKDRLQTEGLEWFSGQEVECAVEGGSEQDWLRRIVRLVHDIATNGPLTTDQAVPDLDENQQVLLSLKDEARVIYARIGSEMDISPAGSL
jgi:hypothetical protein